MKTLVMLSALIFAPLGTAWSMDGSDQSRMIVVERACPQVIHCGIKDGKAKEYPTQCAAEDDGATNIAPKTGETCPEIK